MKNLVTRAATGIIYVVLLVGCTLYGPLTSYFFFSIVCAAALWEFGTVVNKHAGAQVNRPMNALAGFLLVSATWLYCIGYEQSGKVFGLYGILLLYIIITELYRNNTNPLKDWAYSFASQIYVALPFALISFISLFYEPEAGKIAYIFIYPLALFIFLWTSDTGAYLFGCSLSRYIPYKLFPRISPKKSWIGSIGGGLLAIVAACIIAHFFSNLSLLQWIGFALVVVVMGTWGDLVESMLKRQVGIKDSGNILPGHGGLLDRFDSFLLSCPAVAIYLYFIG